MKLTRLFSTSLAAACALVVATSVAPASAQQPAAPPQTAAAGKGLPMWVIRDADSTIYVTGTVHVLPGDVDWMSDRLAAAIGEATQVWFEIAELGTPEGLNAHLMPILEGMLVSEGPPLSSLLTEDERTQLDVELKKVGTPADIIAKIDKFQPAYAVYAIDRGGQYSGGWSEEHGIDLGLARIAMAQGDIIKGLETIEFQLSDLEGVTPEEQLEALRERLRPGDAMKDALSRVAVLAYGSWARGDTTMVEALETMMRAGSRGDSTEIDALLLERNENWAGQVEEMLKGSGVTLIAVGAMHLVGPKSLQERLKLRGIEAKRY